MLGRGVVRIMAKSDFVSKVHVGSRGVKSVRLAEMLYGHGNHWRVRHEGGC